MAYADGMIRKLESGDARAQLRYLYGAEEGLLRYQQERYAALIRRHAELFGDREDVQLISAPGRTEIGGNHTDHNHGRVLAAAVNLDALCAATPRNDLTVRFHSEGYAPVEIDLSDLSVRPEEEGTTAALIRGVAAGMKEAGYRIGGFDAAVTSTVAGGSGLSSSAALEVMLTGVLDSLYNRFEMPYVLRAQISKQAENKWFGKPSGLLDQMASAAGGLVTVDFRDTDRPEVEAISYDFARKGYVLAVVATGGSHANLTDQYAAIPAEMKQVAECFGQPVLRGVTAEQLTAEAGRLRGKVSDRALLRAFHFIREDERVPQQVAALKEDRIEDFLRLIIESGRSSYMYLQNVFADNRDQSLSLALCLAEEQLRGNGAWRIHGGGFAGTTLNFVPLGQVETFVSVMENAFGKGACKVLNIRPAGAARIQFNS
ncbi:MAG: galactokinase [Clostridiales bacterium]|nr:galactokinase [Clostridiales bacterium]